ncbi:MAG TPA: glycosyltransferase family 39 protein, partial [Longimicrobium sp.]|nr:glycosyltransferase family 39 protein [Longimicrobium sp.]
MTITTRAAKPAGTRTHAAPRARPHADAPVPAPASPSGREWWALAAVLAVAAGLRVWGITTFPLDQDELYTAAEARDLWHVALWPGIHARPAYFLLQHAILWLAPPTPLGLRIAPLLFGVAGVGAVWMLARRVFGPAAGLSAAVLAALSPWHVYESGFARYWSLLFLLGTLFPLALWEAYGTGRRRDLALGLAVLCVGTATHPSFVFPAAGAAL